MNGNLKRWMRMAAALAAMFAAAGAWAQDNASQATEWEQQAVALVAGYAQSQEQMGIQEQAVLREQVRLMLREMEALGYTRRIALRAALQGMREVMAQLHERVQNGQPGELGDQLGTLLRTRLREQIRLASYEQTRAQVREQDRERLQQQPQGLVPGGPFGNGPGGGKH